MERRHFCRLVCLALLAFASGCGVERIFPGAFPAERDNNNRFGAPAPDRDAGLSAPGRRQKTAFYERLEDNAVRCSVCFRGCVVPEGGVGFCLNRENVGGELYNIVYGRPSAVQFDPVEKEPLHHFLPGTEILCIGTAGCNFRCKFCHNWPLSQQSIHEIGRYYELLPEEVVQKALDRWRPPSLSFTYNEPTVFYEYVYAIAAVAAEKGVRVVFHSNGTMTPEALRPLLQYVDAVTIDLKAFSDDFYRTVSQGELKAVLKTLEIIKEEGVWLEVVNLVIPTLNDDLGEIRAMCRWICGTLGAETPLHFSRFFPAYRLTDLPPTPVETLEAAHALAREEGLMFVSIGNVPGHKFNSTYCPGCGEVLIGRVHFTVHEINLEEGRCKFCGQEVPGVWA